MKDINQKKLFSFLVAALFLASMVMSAQAPVGPTVPPGFEAVKLASGLSTNLGVKGITSALFRSGDGAFARARCIFSCWCSI